MNAARFELLSRGVEVSEVFHDAGGGVAGGFRAGTDGRAPGPDLKAGPRGRMPRSAIPPANGWLLEETTERLLGRL